MNIGEKLRQARIDANMTQDTLAETLAVSRQTISNWENGRSYPDIINIMALSGVYNMTLDSLLRGDDEGMNLLKESTGTVKSNKRIVMSLMMVGFALLVICVLGMVYQLAPRGIIIGIMLLIVGFIAFHLDRRTSFDTTKGIESRQEVYGKHDVS